jgi:hypothetical protein
VFRSTKATSFPNIQRASTLASNWTKMKIYFISNLRGWWTCASCSSRSQSNNLIINRHAVAQSKPRIGNSGWPTNPKVYWASTLWMPMIFKPETSRIPAKGCYFRPLLLPVISPTAGKFNPSPAG